MRVLRRFLRTYVPRHLGLYTAGLLCLLATTAVMITVPKVIGRMIDQLQQPDVTFPLLQPTLTWLITLAGLLMVFRTVSRLALFYPGRQVEHDLRQTFFARVTELPRQHYDRWSVGDLMSRGVNDVSAVRVMLSMAILHVANALVLGVGAVHGMFSLSPRLTGWVAGPLFAMCLTTVIAVRFIYRFVRRAQEALGRLSESVRETLGASRLFNTYPIHPQLMARFDRWNHDYSQAVQQVATVRACVFPLMTTFIGVGVLLVLWIGGRMVIQGTLALGTLVAMMTYVWILADPAVALGWVINAMQRGHSALVRLDEVIDAAGPEPSDAGGTPGGAVDRLEVRGLRFAYPPSHPDRSGADGRAAGDRGDSFTLAIDHLEVRAGARLGIFGPTGSGKSTLAKLLAGVLEPQAGLMAIDGSDQREVPMTQWRRWVSYVPQQTTLFSTSIEENIRMGNPRHPARLAEAITCSVLGAEVANFPHGLATGVGEDGITLSGGQRQRVSLARAYYHGGSVVILDDMTSAVDLLTEARLLTEITTRLASAILIVISHRVSTLCRCEDILVLEHGRVVDRGTHEELAARNAFYRATWEHERRTPPSHAPGSAGSPTGMIPPPAGGGAP